MRLDVYLVENGICESRNKASRLISEGKIRVDGATVTKPSYDVPEGDHAVEVTEAEKFVGRGGLKLDAALEHFGIDPKGLRCIDVGASTGGFTECLLIRGAAHVCAVDSGRGQLHPRLLEDIRVSSVEGYNARALSPEEFGLFDLAVMDVSFISQTLLHGPVASVLRENASFVSLIKPQFEAGKSALGKHGVVKSASDREEAVRRVLDSAALFGFLAVGLMRSPIEGGDGNREYLVHFIKKEGDTPRNSEIFNVKQLCKD